MRYTQEEVTGDWCAVTSSIYGRCDLEPHGSVCHRSADNHWDGPVERRGTRCIPFSDMTTEERVDHLRLAHGWTGDDFDEHWEWLANEHKWEHSIASEGHIPHPHTHTKKVARRS